MVKELKELLKKSYAPWSKFHVAAIAVDAKGNKYSGVNVENAAFPSGLCAERCALFSSVAQGAIVGDIKEIHIISSGEEIISPCAGCRQVMTEFMKNDALVYQYNNEGDKMRINKIIELVPFPIRGEQIK
ncbi:cytidine deaminase [Mycoplasmopsis lipofaciens]|uniref:cytidine deaminase n=1 Tax=Mycoplasmopsis lipofaciens TaxID=114884 RepID=UPI000B2E6D94|nr:cytidine deaminase [Mycoplasmopsis lipofaciens]